MIPPLLVQPRGFVGSMAHADLGGRLFECCRREDPQNMHTIAISKAPSNDIFYVSSVSSAVVCLTVGVFAKCVRAKDVRVVILAWPNTVCCIDKKGNVIASGSDGRLQVKARYEPYKWSDATTDVVRARIDVSASYEEVEQSMCGAKAAGELRESLASSLLENERIQRDLNLLRQKRDVKRSEAVKRCLKAEKDLDALKTGVSLMVRQAKAVRCEFESIKAEVRDLLEKHATASSLLEPGVIVQLVRTAVQCAHYFEHDRFTSPHFRKHIVVEDGLEGIPIATLLKFPLLVELIAGDSAILKAACGMLKGVCVTSDTVWMG